MVLLFFMFVCFVLESLRKKMLAFIFVVFKKTLAGLEDVDGKLFDIKLYMDAYIPVKGSK